MKTKSVKVIKDGNLLRYVPCRNWYPVAIEKWVYTERELNSNKSNDI